MKIPPLQPTSFQTGFVQYGKDPLRLIDIDVKLFWHCNDVAKKSADATCMRQALGIAHNILRTECDSRRIVVPPADDATLSAITAELLELGAKWDADMARRLKCSKGYKSFHAVFDDWARKKSRPELAFHGALRMFRTIELLLQPL